MTFFSKTDPVQAQNFLLQRHCCCSVSGILDCSFSQCMDYADIRRSSLATTRQRTVEWSTTTYFTAIPLMH